MPESTCLHIQGRESGPIRVVELPWISVRIGRAAYCEVQLTEYNEADEACRLQRRGRSWHLMPIASRSRVLVEGRPIDGPCQIPFDVPFYVGTYCFTLRRDRAAEPDWEMYQGPAPRQLNHVAPALDASFSARLGSNRAPIGVDPRPAAEPEQPPGPLAGRAELKKEKSHGPAVKDRWEARWRAAGAELKARAERTPTASAVKRPNYATSYDSVPLKAPRVARPEPMVPPKIDARTQPFPSPAVPKMEVAPPHPFEESDFENRLEEALSDVVDHESTSSALDAPQFEDRAGGEEDPVPSEASRPDASEGNQQAEPTAVLSDARETAELVASDREITPVKDRDVARADTSLEVEPHQPETSPVESDPIPELPDSKATKGTATGARLIDQSLARDDVRSSRRATGDRQWSDTPRSPSSRGRSSADRRRVDSGSVNSEAAHDNAEWPTVQDILATHRAVPNRSAPPRTPVKPRRKTTTQASPTLAREPEQWKLPLWFAWPPVAAFVLIVGVAGCVLSWTWGNDSYSAAIMTNRLILADSTARRTPLPESVTPPSGTWMETSAQHLVHWASYLNRFEGQNDDSPRAIRDLLDRALQISPINATARLAAAQLEPTANATTPSIRGLGLSRDPISLAWSARRLLEAGKKEAALKLYGQALQLASRGEFSQVAAPRFSDDQGVPRYLLPGEERTRDIVREMVARNDWTVDEWLDVVPRQALATLAAARMLREQTRNEVADALLDRTLNQPTVVATDGPIEPLALAARAEALALRSKLREASEAYQAAIDLLDDETLKRSWWFNLADIASRLADDSKRQAALRATLTVAASDDISRRATAILRATHARPTLRSTGAKAN